MTPSALARALALAAPVVLARAAVVSLLAYGGVGDGVTDNTAAFAKAVAAVAALGGGTLLVPAGTFVTRAFNLTSSMTLFLDDGAAIQSGLDYGAWPLIAHLPTYPGDGPRYSPLIGGYDLHDVRIIGNASAATHPKIDGVGLAWALANELKLLKGQRPHAIELARLANIEIAFIALDESAFWSMHLSETADVWIHDSIILAATPNGDGIDVGAQNVLIERMYITTADDAIVIKSGDAPVPNAFPPSRNVTIRDSTLASGEACIAIGSEMTAGVEDVLVENVTCEAAGHALLYVKERQFSGGFVRNVLVRDSVITGPVERFLWLSQHFGEGGENAPNGAALPILSNITLRNISVAGGGGVVEAALLNGAVAPPGVGEGGAGAILGLVLEDIDLNATLVGWSCANASGVFRNVIPTPCAAIEPET